MTEKQVSRQRRWQIRQQESGNCPQCGEKKDADLRLCLRCTKNRAERMRKKGGFSEWKPGGKGRPPAWSKLEKKNDA